MNRLTLYLILFLCCLASMSAAQSADNQQSQNPLQQRSPSQVQIDKAVGNTPVAFTRNMGQWPDSILFRTSIGSTTMWFTRNGIYYQFLRRIPREDSAGRSTAAGNALATERPDIHQPQHDSIEITMIKAEFVGASASAEAIGLEEMDYKSNYFLGSDPSRWHSDVPNYSTVALKNLYPGVDINFRWQGGRLEYQPKAVSQKALDQVQVEYRGADVVVKRSDGTSVLQTRTGEKVFAGAVPAAQSSTTFSAAAVVAAPSGVSLVYSTYLGGGTPESAYGIAIDGAGSAYVTGQTFSDDFPRLNPYDNTLGGNDDAFVTKLTPTGNGLVYSTYLGGSGEDAAYGIGVDAAGCAYVAGQTSSSDFPRLSAYDNSLGGTWDAFATKLKATGNGLVYSTFVGGSEIDLAFGMAVDTTGKACITGITSSPDFPSLNAFDNTLGGTVDGFVTKLGTSGTSLVFSTYLGGDGQDNSYAIAVSEQGAVYVTGSTNSTNFPLQTPIQASLAGDSDIFVTKLASAGNTLEYSTYLGGAADDVGYAIVYGGSDNVYVTGRTNSTNFPTYTSSGHPYQSTFQGAMDAFVAEISHTASPLRTSLVYSTYLGGRYADKGLGIARQSDNVYVTGYTYSDNFPVVSAFQPTLAGGTWDAFVAKLPAGGNSLTYSTYLGGNGYDEGRDVAVDASGFAYVTGYTFSTNFPTQGPYQTDKASYDAFVTKLSASLACCLGTRGNVNTVGIIDVSDLSLLVAYLITSPPPSLPCPDAANVNATGIIDLSDLSLLVTYLTANPAPALPNCP